MLFFPHGRQCVQRLDVGLVVWKRNPASALSGEQLVSAVYGDPVQTKGAFTNLRERRSGLNRLSGEAKAESRQTARVACDGTKFCDL